MDNGNGRLIVPLYQRNYDWTKRNCKQLMDDIIRLVDPSNPVKRHFTGAIIFTNECLDKIIIDGQQRITTVLLILMALRDAVKTGEISSNDPDILVFLRGYIGKNGCSMVLCGKDNDAFTALYEGKYGDDWSKREFGQTNLWTNYSFMKSLLIDSNSGDDFAERVLDAVRGLWIVPIELKAEDDAQAAFESINTTGLKLSDSDRIRNFVMMNHSQTEQRRIYDEYWTKIERYLGNAIDQFFIDFLRAEKQEKVVASDNGIYRTFKDKFSVVKEKGDGKWATLDHIRRCALLYHHILIGDITEYSSPEASRALRYISYLNQGVVYSFILKLLEAQTQGELNRSEVSNSIIIVETYIERRIAAKEQSNVLNGFFPSLFKTVMNLPGNAPFNDKLAYLLLSKQGNLSIPSDDIIKSRLVTRDVYKSSEICTIILSVANYVNKDSPEILDMIDREDGYTIDHILPKNPDREWYATVPNLDNVKSRYLNTIGNLTLTAYNSNFGNRSFDYRLNTEGIGYRYSPLRINDYLKEQTSWGEEQIVERADIVIRSFLRNRPIPSSNGYVPEENETLFINMDDDPETLTGTQVIGYEYKEGSMVPVKSAIEAFVGLIKEIYMEHPDELTAWAKDTKSSGFISNLHDYPECGDIQYYCISQDVFVFGNMSNHGKFTMIRKMLDALEEDPASVIVRYRPKSKSNGNKKSSV